MKVFAAKLFTAMLFTAKLFTAMLFTATASPSGIGQARLRYSAGDRQPIF